MHTLLDLRGSIPTFIEITDGKIHDVNILDELLPEPGCFYIMDRGYLDFERLYVLNLFLGQGISSKSFAVNYYQKAKRNIINDNRYGRILFFLNDIISSTPLLTQSHFHLAKKKGRKGPSKKLQFLLWNMFTGNLPYRQIFRTSLDPKLQFSLAANTLKILLLRMKKTSFKRD